MDARKDKQQVAFTKTRNSRDAAKRTNLIAAMIRSVVGGLIGMVLTSLFSLVVFAFVIKAFVSSEQMSYQLLNSAITLVGTTLGAVLGFFLGRNTNDKPQE